MSWLYKIRYWLSIILTELPGYQVKLKRPNDDWLYLANRKQISVPAPTGCGLSILGDFTSYLRAPRLFPYLSKSLFQKALNQFEFQFDTARKRCGKPKVSYIIGHRGSDKILHLKLVIASIAAQSYDDIECIVVEQSKHSQLHDQLPDWVDYYHLQVGESDLYNRALSFNYGVEKCQGDYLVLHDNDLLVPVCYTNSHIELLESGFDLANLKRYIFGLTKKNTEQLLNNQNLNKNYTPDYILQNAKGGGSLFITRSAYKKIGGFDERFCGWGGEDNEFWQRAQILNIYPFANLPLIHLWHSPQADKRGGRHGGGRYTEKLLDELSQISIYDRIEFLHATKS